MEQLIQDIANLEAQETIFLADLEKAETQEQERQITNELNIVRNKLSEKREELKAMQEKEQQRAEAIEEKVQAEGVPFAIADIDFTELPAEVIKLIDAVVRADRRRLLNEHAIELELKEKEIVEVLEANRGISDAYDDLSAENEKLSYEKMNLEENIERLESELKEVSDNRNNAARMLSEAETEIKRLKSEIEDYQRAKVFGERESQKIIDVTPEENSDIRAAMEGVKKLYTKTEDWGSVIKVYKPDGSFERVQRDELDMNWEPIVPDVLQFRDEEDSLAGNADVQPVSTETSAVEPPPIHTEDTFQSEPAQDDVLAGLGATDAGETVSRAEFEARMTNVEKGMDMLMRKVFGEVAA